MHAYVKAWQEVLPSSHEMATGVNKTTKSTKDELRAIFNLGAGYDNE